MKLKRFLPWGAVVLSGSLLLGGCSTGGNHQSESQAERLSLVTTTPIIADLVKQVAGERGTVTSLVPAGADPHTYETSLRDVRKVVYADAVFSNNLLLEEQALIRTVDANLPEGVPNTRLAEESKKYGAKLIQLVEDPSLNTIWLGMRVNGEGTNYGADRSSEVRLQARGASTPKNGIIAGYITGTFGQPQVYLNSSDGFQAGDGYRSDTVKLPTNAHTHVSWTFTEPGIYTLDLGAQLANQADAPAQAKAGKCETTELAAGKAGETEAGEKTSTAQNRLNPQLCEIATQKLTFAVGVDPHKVPHMPNAQVLSSGHMDISVDLNTGKIDLYGDRADKKAGDAHYDPNNTVIEVPNSALNEIPANPEYRFLGKAGTPAYVLAQAVLGKHVHGEIDPHVWESVPNTIAMVQVIRDRLIQVDPAHQNEYRENAQEYINTLKNLHRYISELIGRIPPAQRNLVTTHDAFGYLADTYGLKIAGFVSSNPQKEPAARDIVKLTRTLKELNVPAVFIEPNMVTHVNDLQQAAARSNVKICKIYGDTFTEEVTNYVQLMAENAYNLKVCLDPDNAAPKRFTQAKKEEHE